MAFTKRSCSIIAIKVVVLLVMSSLGATGLSSWNETAIDFPSGEMVNTGIDNDALALALDPAFSGNWTKVSDMTSPAPRNNFSMVYDSQSKVHVLYGGGGVYRSSSTLNDTWSFNILSKMWEKRSPAGTIPPRIKGQAMAFDFEHNVSIMFGGVQDYMHTPAIHDTYIYDYANNGWEIKYPSSRPQERILHSMVYDSKNKHIVLFGGATPDYYPIPDPDNYELRGDTWTYEYSTNNWTCKNPSNPPMRRCGQAMCYDQKSGLSVLFGGKYSYGIIGDTWTYDLKSNSWVERNPQAHPPRRTGAVMAADESGNIILFGGEYGSALYNDTWTYNVSNNAWTELETPSGPSSRSFAAMSYDRDQARMFLLGGHTNFGDLDDFWSFDLAKKTWVYEGELTTPEPRNAFSCAYDSQNKAGVMFGGYSRSGLLNDTWIFDSMENRWIEKHPPTSPSRRANAPMCFDPDDGLMILYGGAAVQSNETWTYDVSTDTWVKRVPAISPGADLWGSMVYDRRNSRAILFLSNANDRSETWTYSLASNFWTNRTGSSGPSPRWSSSMAYDETSHIVVLFGGVDQSNYYGINDTWVLDPDTFIWTQRHPAISPPRNDGQSAYFDSARSTLVLFDGLNGETWTYYAMDDIWTNATPSRSPTTRYKPGIIYDSDNDVAILFGGYRYEDLGDTWIYNMSGRLPSGSFTSTPKDTGGAAYFGSLEWTSSIPTGTGLKFQLRTGSTLVDLESRNFTGPDASSNTYFIASGQQIPSFHNASRWIQYCACLTTDDILTTPTLSSVRIGYNLVHEVAIASPSGAENWTGIQNITWSADDKDNDTLSFDIDLLDGLTTVPLARGLANGYRQWSWNTDEIKNGTYQIRITARDDNPSIPLSVNATSDNFTIQHPIPPPANHPPRVTLVSPANNSYLRTASVILRWLGVDLDGDPLTFTVRHSDHPFASGPILTNLTTGNDLPLDGLADNTTYYWTVDASDGKSNSTVFPCEIWSFTVRLPPANIPVRFTSIPPTIAWVGKEYAYNLTSVDEDNDIPAYALVSGPSNITLDPSTGRLRWTPTSADIANHTVTVRVSDGRGSSDNQTFTIDVRDIPVPPPVAPRCTILSPVNGSVLLGTLHATGSAKNGSARLRAVQLRIDDGGWSDAVGLEEWTADIDITELAPGSHVLQARAVDGNLISETASVVFLVPSEEHGPEPEPPVTIEKATWCLPAVIIAVVAGAVVLLLLRKKTKRTG